MYRTTLTPSCVRTIYQKFYIFQVKSVELELHHSISANHFPVCIHWEIFVQKFTLLHYLNNIISQNIFHHNIILILPFSRRYISYLDLFILIISFSYLDLPCGLIIFYISEFFLINCLHYMIFMVICSFPFLRFLSFEYIELPHFKHCLESFALTICSTRTLSWIK